MEATGAKSPYLNYARAEEYTTLDRVTLWRAVKAGRLKASGYGRAIRFHVKDLDSYTASRNGKKKSRRQQRRRRRRERS